MKISKELIKGSTAMLVMSILKKSDMYGYKIIKELELQSESVFELKEGEVVVFTLSAVKFFPVAFKQIFFFKCVKNGVESSLFKLKHALAL